MKSIEEEYWELPEVWSTSEDLEWLKLLSSDSKEALTAQEFELAQCKINPWRWLTHWVKTEDAHNKEQPFQPFPADLHLYVTVKYWQEYTKLLMPKSRQMTVTWLFSALYLHDSMFWPSRNTFFQCKKEEDADMNLQRSRTIWEYLPQWQKDWQPMKYVYCQGYFPRSRSKIICVPEGSKHFRQQTLTSVFKDEAAFSDDLGEVIGATKSALGETGKFTAVSSASPSYFRDLVFDEI